MSFRLFPALGLHGFLLNRICSCALLLLLCATAAYGQSPAPAAASEPGDCVILLHGLARSSKSMIPLGEQLQAAHYTVVNQDYPSREYTVADLASIAIPPALAECRAQSAQRIHFVTHSLGGIVLRQYLLNNSIPELARVVMFAPPNKGSEVVDHLKYMPGFYLLNGPAGLELGTGENSVPSQLAKQGPVTFDLGVIAGTRSINLLLSMHLPNPDDGKVSVASTKVEGMRDFMTLPVSHPFIMKDPTAIAQTLHYLQHGQFLHAEPSTAVGTQAASLGAH